MCSLICNLLAPAGVVARPFPVRLDRRAQSLTPRLVSWHHAVLVVSAPGAGRPDRGSSCLPDQRWPAVNWLSAAQARMKRVDPASGIRVAAVQPGDVERKFEAVLAA